MLISKTLKLVNSFFCNLLTALSGERPRPLLPFFGLIDLSHSRNQEFSFRSVVIFLDIFRQVFNLIK